MILRNISCLVTLVLISTSCSSGAKEVLGLKKPVPDEFQVISNPSLSVPPDFHLIDPNETLSRDDIYKQSAPLDGGKLKGDDRIFIDQLTGGDENKSKIRQVIDQENISKKEGKGLIRSKVDATFKNDREPVIDPVAERERIKANLDEGKPVNDGDVKVETQSTLGKLFS